MVVDDQATTLKRYPLDSLSKFATLSFTISSVHTGSIRRYLIPLANWFPARFVLWWFFCSEFPRWHNSTHRSIVGSIEFTRVATEEMRLIRSGRLLKEVLPI